MALVSHLVTLLLLIFLTSHKALADDDVNTTGYFDLENIPTAVASVVSSTYFVTKLQNTSVNAHDTSVNIKYRDNSVTSSWGVTTVTMSPTTNVTTRATKAKATLSRTELLACAVVLAILSAFGTCGNIVSMYVYLPRGKQTNLYVFYLSIIDFIMSGILIPFTITSFFVTSIPTALTLLYAVGLVLIVLQSIEILVFISIDRYIACSHPQMYRKVQRYAKYVIGGQIAFNIGSLAMSLVPQAAIVFTVVCQLVIVGSFIVMVTLYIVIFFVLRKRMSKILPAEPTLPTAHPDTATVPRLDIIDTAIDPESPDVEVLQSPSSTSILVKMLTPMELNGNGRNMAEVKDELPAALVKDKPFAGEVKVTAEGKVPLGYTQSVENTAGRNRRVGARLTNARTRNLVATIRMFIAITVVFVISYLPTYLITYKLASLPSTLAYCLFINHVANPLIYFALNKTYRDRARRLLSSILPCCCTRPSHLV